MKRVLVTGASGFVGRKTIPLLTAREYEVHVVDIRKPDPKLPNVVWHCANLLDPGTVSGLMADIHPTHLLHFAWYAEPGKYWRSTENFRWLEASLSLLRHFHQCGGRRVVMAGTCAEYDWDYGYCSEDVTPCKPETPYGVCKNALQKTLRAYCTETGLSGAWGRLFFLYGPDENPARLVPSVITSLLAGGMANCTHGNQIRDFLHVEDVASAFVTLLESEATGPLNIASGQPVTLREIVLAVADYLGARERVSFGALAAPTGEPALIVADNRRLLKLGWSQSYDLKTGIAETVDWWQGNLKSVP